MTFSLIGRGCKGAGGPGDPPAAALTEVRAYWDALRVGRSLPRRDQIDPRGIARALEHVFLIERIAPGLARFRLAGMHINDVIGMEVRGMPLSALFDPAARTHLQAALERVFDSPSILDINVEAERGIGRPALCGRIMILPLIGSTGEPSLAMGCFVTSGSLGRAPRRFAISRLVHEPLLTSGAIPDAPPPALQAPVAIPLREMAETAAASAPAPRPARGAPYLRLVKTDD